MSNDIVKNPQYYNTVVLKMMIIRKLQFAYSNSGVATGEAVPRP